MTAENNEGRERVLTELETEAAARVAVAIHWTKMASVSVDSLHRDLTSLLSALKHERLEARRLRAALDAKGPASPSWNDVGRIDD